MKPRVFSLLLAGLLLGLAAAPAGASPVIIRYICFDRDAKLTKPNPRGVVRGTRGSDVIVTRGARVVLGRGGADRICTFGRSVYVAGGAGNDHISTGSGADTIFGGQGQDLLVGRGGDDRLAAGFGAGDTLVGRGGDDRLEGADEAIDYLFGGSGEDRLFGGDGVFHSDFLVGGEGTDEVDGGTGRDTVSFAFSDVPVQVDLAAGTSSSDVLTAIENVDGSRFDDLLTADDLGSRLSGDDGNDVLLGGAAIDQIDGGLGQDTMDGGGSFDFLSFVTSPLGVSVDLEAGSASGESTESFAAFEHLLGSAYDDELSGDAGSNEIFGGRGSDALFGRDDNDTLESGSSGDAGPGEDTCLDSGGTIANCEQDLHGDPPAFSTILGPTQGSTISIPQFKEVWGSASGGAFGPDPENVQIALRRLSGSGCYWWDVRQGLMRAGHCERPLWVDTDFDDGQGTWSRRIPGPVQLLNAGLYQLRSRIRQPGYTEPGFNPTYNLVEFRLH